MTLKIKSILSLLLAFLLTFAACSAAPHKERVPGQEIWKEGGCIRNCFRIE